MGNCTSCGSSKIQEDGFGCPYNALHIPSRVDHDDHGHLKYVSFGCVHSHQGVKGLNQDAALLHEGYGSCKDGAFCGVFDGHGPNGHIVSKMVRNKLPSSLLSQKRLTDEWEDAFVSAFKATDKEINLLDDVDCSFSGTTAVIVVKQGENLIIANLGDSRAILGTSIENGTKATQLTVDLKPGLPAETERIKKSKGRVFALKHEPHIQRVWLPNEDMPGLAMSRAFGDFDMKSYGIIVTPQISYHRLTSQDHFLVLASDGIWDVLSNEEVVSIVWATKKKEEAAKAVVDKALATWERKFPKAKVDDCTVVCLFLQDRVDNMLPLMVT